MTTCETPLICLSALTIGHDRRALLGNINLEVRPGDFLAVVGPNGSGKTTLLSTMLGGLRPVAGRVTRRDKLVIGYVPQRGQRDPVFGLTVAEVVASGGLALGAWRGWDLHFSPADRVRKVLGELNILELERQLFRDLSGGQQQRVLMARALVRRPELLVLDEPTAGMDLPSERDLLELVAERAAQGNTAVVLVTHQLALAARHAQTIALMNKDTGQFAVDETERLLDERRLSDLFGRPMSAHRCADGDWLIHPVPQGGAS